MKRMVAAVLTAMLAAAALPAQDPCRLFTRPQLPDEAALDRLNLQQCWRTYLPMDGRRDGIFSIQLNDGSIFVQSLSGLLTCLDAATGVTRWQARLGRPYEVTQPLGFNSTTALATHADKLFGFDKLSGRQLWELRLDSALSSPPAADEDRLYLILAQNRLLVYVLPGRLAVGEGEGLALPPPPSGDRRGVAIRYPVQPGSPVPQLQWEYALVTARIDHPVLVTQENILAGSRDGQFVAFSKLTNQFLYRFQAQTNVSAPMGQHGETAYIAAEDSSLYSLDIASGQINWRVRTGSPILLPPRVQDDDVYIYPEGTGLFRIARTSGQVIWQNRRAGRFLAANPKFVYAADRSGRLLVLDRQRGTVLSDYSGTIDYVFPVANELTDRIYLAAHNGLIVCLHDRDFPTPVTMRTLVLPTPEELAKAKQKSEKEMEKNKDEE